MRAVAVLDLVAMAMFVVLIGAAMWAYPGGSWYDRSIEGHHFFYNFLCDLLRERGLGGGPNQVGALLSRVGMLAMVVGLAMHWIVVRALVPSHPVIGWVVLLAGLLASVATVAVALSPSDRLPRLHTASVLVAGTAGALAATLSVFTVARAKDVPHWLGWLGVLTWASVLVAMSLFVHHTWLGGGHLRLLPTMQRLATIFGAGYIMGCAARLLRNLPR